MILAVTGGAGAIGAHLVPALAAHGHTVRVLDQHRPSTTGAGIEVWPLDLRDGQATLAATAGADVVIHLAGITDDAPLPEIYEHNLLPAWHVLEAARCHRIPRVVLASSHHVVGFTPVGQTIASTDTAPVPDSVYGVSKTAIEALGSLYVHKHGLEVAAIRIGSMRPVPSEPRHAATWLSPRDATALLHAAATRALPTPFTVVYGTSDNPLCWWPRSGWSELGYHPQDSAQHHQPVTDHWHGGTYASTALAPNLSSGELDG